MKDYSPHLIFLEALKHTYQNYLESDTTEDVGLLDDLIKLLTPVGPYEPGDVVALFNSMTPSMQKAIFDIMDTVTSDERYTG